MLCNEYPEEKTGDPSATEVSIMESIRICYETYCRMVKKYGAEHIAVVGGSFGGYYALQIINRINALNADTPMPGLVIALSPGGVPDDEESLNQMKALSKWDPIISMEVALQTRELARWYDALLCLYADLSGVQGSLLAADQADQNGYIICCFDFIRSHGAGISSPRQEMGLF